MTLLDNLYFVIQLIFVIMANFFQLAAAVRTGFQRMYFRVGHFIIRNRTKSVLLMSGLPAFRQV